MSQDFDNKLICLKYFSETLAVDFEDTGWSKPERALGACMRDALQAPF